MKERKLADGISCIGIGLFFVLIGLLPGIQTGEHLTGLAAPYLTIGILSVIRHFYYHSPKNREFYKEMLENEEIERKDERRIQIKDKAGRYAHQFGMYAIVLAIMAAVVLEAFGVIRDADTVVMCLGTYLLVQIIVESVIFDYISKKY